MPQTRNRTRSGAPAQEQASTESAEQKTAEETTKPVAKEEAVEAAEEQEEKMENDKGEEANGEEKSEDVPDDEEVKEVVDAKDTETKEVKAESKTDGPEEEKEKEKEVNDVEEKPAADAKEEQVNDHNSEEQEGETTVNDDENKASGEDASKEKKEKPQIELDEKAKTYVVVVVGYVTYADFGLTELKLPLLKCVSFETRFFQDEDTKKGYVTMYFTKSWDAYVAVDKLRGLEVPRGGSESTSNYNCWLLDKKTAHNLMHQETTTLRQLRTQLNSTNEQDPSLRSLFVANIPKSATKELLTAIFAEAQDIVLPLAEPGKNKGYCYIEFNDAEKLDEYLTKYQDIKIEDGEVSAKIIIRKLGNSIVEKGKDRANRLLKARSKQQISDLVALSRVAKGKKNSSESKKKVRRGPSNYRGGSFNRSERYNRQYRARQYGGGGGGGGGGGYGGGGFGRGGGRDSERRGNKRRLPSGPFDDFGDYGMAKARRYDGPMGMMGMEGPSSHFYEDNYEGWGSNSFAQGYGGGGGGYMGGGGGGGYGGGGGMADGRRRKNFRKFKRN